MERIRPALLVFVLPGALVVAACRPEGTKAGDGGSPGVVYRCDGFAGPIEKQMEIQRGRTLPLKAQLLDAAGKRVTSEKLDAAPQIRLFRVDGGAEVDQSEQAAAGDFGSAGKFVFRESYWKFDLATADFPELGTYRAELVSGDDSRYRVDPRCSLNFTLK